MHFNTALPKSSQTHTRSPYRDGYPAVAAWISRDPDHESYVFRRFDRLRARNLLHLQSGLIELESQLDTLDQQAAVPGVDHELKHSCRRWETLAENAHGREDLRKRMDLVVQIEEKLEKYRRCSFS